MYPLNMMLAAPAIGYAVANDDAEHATLTDAGYQPPLAADVSDNSPGVHEFRAQLDAAGIPYDKRWGLKRLSELLPS